MFAASVVITTKNRREDLCKSIVSALQQTFPLEILVMDDASTDGTAEHVKRHFPQVQVHRSEVSLGYIVQRNRAARLAKSGIIISMDDDAIFSSEFVVGHTLREFDNPRVGAVAIPFVDVNRGPSIYQCAPQAEKLYAIYSFTGTAHALRRDLFLKLGGYRENLIHQGEEEDYCLRLLDAGFITRCGRSDPILHFESPRRSFKRMDYYGARNKILYAWHNVPWGQLPMHLAGTTFKSAIYTFKPDRLLTRLCGIGNAYASIFSGQIRRRPVNRKSYRASQNLKRNGPQSFDKIEALLSKTKRPQPLITCES
ncbi:MAG TPA: glycosyltransferase [Verrucomicrobiae bacterium]|nr:glycosyltransferase [Verrucomicrobiae bacterium]